MRRTVDRPADLRAAAAAGRAVRFWSRSTFEPIGLFFMALVLAVGIGFIVWTGGNVFGVMAGVLVIVLGLWLLLFSLRPALTLAAGTLRIPRGFGTIRIPVNEVTGIGLVAVSGGLPGWNMLVWHGDECRESISIRYIPTDSPSVAAETDPEELAETYAGQVAGDIYRYVLAEQGPAGLLAVTEHQKHVRRGSRWSTEQILAFWSPDGVVGPPEAN